MVLKKYEKLKIGELKESEKKYRNIKAPLLEYKGSFGEGIPFGDPNYI
jgi:hypothetical protein